MAGLSSRFAQAGYDLPKYMLPLRGHSLFHHAVQSFRFYFATQTFLFVIRNEADTLQFVEWSCRELGIRDFHIVVINAPTAGQAETVSLGLDGADISMQSPMTIFNIDTFRPGFRFPEQTWIQRSDGYLEVIPAVNPGLSFVRPDPNSPDPLVLETAEKRVISRLASTGLYHFRDANDFRQAFITELNQPSAAELYVAPLYNHLIANGRRIHFNLINYEDVVFCGVPSEYEALGSDSS